MTADLKLLHPKLQPLCAQFLADCADKIKDCDIIIAQTWRSRKQQQALYDASLKTGAVVAKPGNSKHEHCLANGTPASLAFDAMAVRGGKLVRDGDDPVYKQMGLIWKALSTKDIPLNWGGDFHRVDVDHFELA